MKIGRGMVMVAVVVGLVGCAVGPSEKHVKDDASALCLRGGTQDALVVLAELDSCASGCAADIVATCTARRDGNTIVVTSHAEWTTPSAGVACPDSCTVIQATCALDGELPPGHYDFVSGARRWDVELAAVSGASTCVE